MVTRNILKKNKNGFILTGMSNDNPKTGSFFNQSITNYIYYTNHNSLKNNKFFFKYLFLIIKKLTNFDFHFLFKLYDSFLKNCTTVNPTVRQFLYDSFPFLTWRI
jgi:hypothetical protein